MRIIVPALAVLTGVGILALAQTSRPASRPTTRNTPSSMPATAPAAVAGVSAAGSAGNTRVALEAKPLQAEGLALAVHNGKALLTVAGPGIGKLLLERKSPHWPDELRVRLCLRGLESIVLSCGGKTLSGSVSSHGSASVTLCLLDEDAKEGPPLPSSSPFWAEITPHDAAGKALADLPPDGGYFELVIPKALLADDADTLKLRWVDFWR
ncbi:MAG: hypothetical protein NT031_16230 [Planctomycetota bacterium]|nr:hypothetical protein [Planctomycetota bacterium]